MAVLYKGPSSYKPAAKPGAAAKPAAAPKPDLAQKFGFAPAPESVRRLAGMIARRGANMEDFAKIAAEDPELTDHLLRVANPRATRKADYVATTAAEAIQRVGMSYALVLAMTDPLKQAVFAAFHTMMSIELQAVPPHDLTPLVGEHLVGEVGFAGKTTGLVDLRLPRRAAVLFGERMLGLPAEDMADPALANDVVGELCNMVVGNFKSNVCDAGLECKLSSPAISLSNDFNLQCVQGGAAERYAFQCPELEFFADLTVNPWVDDWQ